MRPWLAPLLVCLAFPVSASAAPPWSPPVELARENVFDPSVLFAEGEGAVFWDKAPGVSAAPDSIFSAPLDPLGSPGEPRRVSGRWGLVSAGRRFTFAAFDLARPLRTLRAGSSGEPGVPFAVREVGRPRRAEVIRAAVAGGGAAWAVRPRGAFRRDRIHLSRLAGSRFTPTRPISRRGRIQELALASNERGDLLAVWLRGGALEARIVTSEGVRSPVRRIARTRIALALDADLGADGTAVVGWVEQSVTEGQASNPARVMAAVRPAGERFGSARLLERFPNLEIVGGRGIRAAIAGSRAVVGWTGHRSLRASIAEGGTRFDGAHDLALLGERPHDNGAGVLEVTGSIAGDALVTWAEAAGGESYLRTAPLAAGAPEFSSAEIVGDATGGISRASAAFDPATGRVLLAWADADGVGFDRILLASRPAF